WRRTTHPAISRSSSRRSNRLRSLLFVHCRFANGRLGRTTSPARRTSLPAFFVHLEKPLLIRGAKHTLLIGAESERRSARQLVDPMDIRGVTLARRWWQSKSAIVSSLWVSCKVHMASTEYGQPYCFVFFCYCLVGTALARLWPRFAQCSRNTPSMTRSSAG